jgi:hypothetical protein
VPAPERLLTAAGQVCAHPGPGIEPALRVTVGDPVHGRQDQPDITQPGRRGAQHDTRLEIEIGVREKATRPAQLAAHASNHILLGQQRAQCSPRHAHH